MFSERFGGLVEQTNFTCKKDPGGSRMVQEGRKEAAGAILAPPRPYLHLDPKTLKTLPPKPFHWKGFKNRLVNSQKISKKS